MLKRLCVTLKDKIRNGSQEKDNSDSLRGRIVEPE